MVPNEADDKEARRLNGRQSSPNRLCFAALAARPGRRLAKRALRAAVLLRMGEFDWSGRAATKQGSC